MKLEDYSRDELKELVKQRGLTGYHNLAKKDLIKLLHQTMDNESNIVSDEAYNEATKHKILSLQAQRWNNYFVKLNIEPQVYLNRYPNHKYRSFIEEVIAFRNGRN